MYTCIHRKSLVTVMEMMEMMVSQAQAPGRVGNDSTQHFGLAHPALHVADEL